jgi:hypothetical protein
LTIYAPVAEQIIAYAANPSVLSPMAHPVNPFINVTAVPTRPNARALELYTQVINTQGWSLNYDVPNGHVMITEELLNELNGLKEQVALPNQLILATNEPRVQPAMEPTATTAHAANMVVFLPMTNPIIPVVQPTVEPPKKKQRSINFHDEVVNTQGQTITCSVPNGKVLISKKVLSELYEQVAKFQRLLKLIQVGKYFGGTEYTNIILVVGLAGSATIPFRTISETISILFLGLHLFDSGYCSGKKFDIEKYVKSFPCDKFLRQRVYKVAAMCTISISVFFTGKPVFLASDKGMIHMVNMCYTWSNVVPKSFILLLGLHFAYGCNLSGY